MPVTGLPATVEKTLTALLTDNMVTSWKVAGEADSTVVVLRLKPANPPLSTNMADPVLNRNTRVQYYRRKPPSQIRRDQERAKQQQQKQASAKQDSDFDTECPLDALFLPDTPSKTSSTQEHVLTTQHGQNDSEQDEDEAESDVFHVHETSETFGTVDCDTAIIQQLDADIEPMIDPSVGGFSTSVVKSYVATLTDKSVQRRLRDKDRNKSFRKVTVQRSTGTDVLMCESDDLVLEFSCTAVSGDSECLFWYVKQDNRNMLTEERAKLASLRKGKRVVSTQHAEVQARAAREMETLHGLIQFYLG